MKLFQVRIFAKKRKIKLKLKEALTKSTKILDFFQPISKTHKL